MGFSGNRGYRVICKFREQVPGEVLQGVQYHCNATLAGLQRKFDEAAAMSPKPLSDLTVAKQMGPRDGQRA